MIEETTKFYSPSKGRMNFREVIEDIVFSMNEYPNERYELVVGTDSHSCPGMGKADFVSAIIIHKIGKGGRYFWTRTQEDDIHNLQQKIYKEATSSFQLARRLMEELEFYSLLEYNLEIHVDIGENGRTKQMIDEVVGMIVGSGFAVKTKPEAYGASSVADKHA